MTKDSASLILGLLFATIVTLPYSSAVECYICSWGPYDNQSDTCTRGKFDQTRMRTHNCQLGCEAIAIYNKNDDLEMFYRNCIKRGSAITNNCRRETTKSFTEEICTCDADRCNSSNNLWSNMHSIWPLLFLPAMLIMRDHLPFGYFSSS